MGGHHVPGGIPARLAAAIDFALAQICKPYIWGGTGQCAPRDQGSAPERAAELDARLEELFTGAGYHGWLCVQVLDGCWSTGCAEEPVVAASVSRFRSYPLATSEH